MTSANRTSTGEWKRIRKHVKRLAQDEGLTNCPSCGVHLDYDVGQTPTSAEVDHIVPHSKGGTNALHNLRILCRRCNQSRGNRDAPKIATVQASKPLKSSRRW